MLTVIRNSQGQIEAACEWVPCDDFGRPTNPNWTNPELGGRWIWINDLEISDSCPRAIAEVILQIAGEFPTAIGAYWYRYTKEKIKRIHQYSRKRLVSRAHRMLKESKYLKELV